MNTLQFNTLQLLSGFSPHNNKSNKASSCFESITMNSVNPQKEIIDKRVRHSSSIDYLTPLTPNSQTPLTIFSSKRSDTLENSIMLDLQKEIDEDKELLDLIVEPQNPQASNHTYEGFKAIFQKKQAKIEMILEEDEEKQRSNSKSNIIGKEIAKEPKKITPLSDVRPKISKRNMRQRQFETLNHNKECQNSCIDYLTIQSFLNQENEKKPIGGFLSISNRKIIRKGIPLITEKISKYPHILGDINDFFKKSSIISSLNYAYLEAQYKYGALLDKLCSARSIYFPKCQTPLIPARPFSNSHQSHNDTQKKDEVVYRSQNDLKDYLKMKVSLYRNSKQSIFNCPLTEFEYVNNQKLEYKNNKCISNRKRLKLRPLHKIKIEKGLPSIKLTDQFPKKLTLNYSHSTKNMQSRRNMISPLNYI